MVKLRMVLYSKRVSLNVEVKKHMYAFFVTIAVASFLSSDIFAHNFTQLKNVDVVPPHSEAQSNIVRNALERFVGSEIKFESLEALTRNPPVAFNGDESLVALGGAGDVILLDNNLQLCLTLEDHSANADVSALTFCDNDNAMLVGLVDGRVSLFLFNENEYHVLGLTSVGGAVKDVKQLRTRYFSVRETIAVLFAGENGKGRVKMRCIYDSDIPNCIKYSEWFNLPCDDVKSIWFDEDEGELLTIFGDGSQSKWHFWSINGSLHYTGEDELLVGR